MSEWRPMGMSEEERAMLVDGVQPWMREDIKLWLTKALIRPIGNSYEIDHEIMRDFDRRAKSVDPLARYLEIGARALEDHLYRNQDQYIRVLDYLVWRKSQAGPDNESVAELDSALMASSSCWKVGTRLGSPGLEKRVPQGVQDAADAAMATPGHAGELLSQAWHSAFGVHPNPVSAYTNAVLAVEAAAIPVVIATDPTASLGKVFAVMRDQETWSLNVVKQHNDYPTTAVLLSMIQMLWAGQGRHAGQPDWAPNTQAEAEVAVLLAVPLVQWFSSGAISRNR